jgi:hypothetical protein
MAKAIRGHNLGTRLAMVLLAALLLLIASAFVVWQATTTGEGVGTPAISADRDGDSRFARDPSIERHAAVVASYRNQADAPATSQDGTGGSRLIRDPSVERHAEVVARYNQGDLR